MITTKGHSIAAVCEWANKAVNNKNGDTAEIQTAFRETLKKGIKRAGYPSCEAELGIIDEISDFDVTPMAEQLPNVIMKYMQDESRAINLPAPDGNTAPATLKMIHREEKTRTGIIQMGEHKGEEYSSTTAAHDEYALKQHTDEFKKN
jgi:hypothetical protein